MAELIAEAVELYATQVTTIDNEVMQAIHAETMANHQHAHMLSSQVQGKLLSFLSTILQPTYVLEIGTFTGYSALCLSEGITAPGQVHTIEIREEDANTALKNFMRAQKQNLITLHQGNAKAIIPTLPYTWDMVFIDADKVSYIEYYELAIERLSQRGIIIADNVLFHGEVLKQPIAGKNAKAIDAFNKHIANDDRVEQVLLTIRDGLLLIKKK